MPSTPLVCASFQAPFTTHYLIQFFNPLHEPGDVIPVFAVEKTSAGSLYHSAKVNRRQVSGLLGIFFNSIFFYGGVKGVKLK